jgi:hypothetical protein
LRRGKERERNGKKVKRKEWERRNVGCRRKLEIEKKGRKTHLLHP